MTYLENNTKTTQTTEVSEELTIENCAGVKGKLDIKSGKSIQEGEPSTDNIIPIRNVGNNINEFSSELELGEISNDTGINSINTNSIRTKDYIKVKPNTTYTIKNSNNYMNVIYFYKKDKTYINYSYSTETSYTFTTGPTAEYIRVRSSSTKKENDLTTKYKLEKGSIATPYTPYGCGSIDYLARNKNLAFLEFSNKVRGYGNGNLTNSDIYDTYKAIVEENTKYTVSFIGNDNNVSNLCYFDKSMNYIKGNPFNSNNPRILTTPQNCKYITLAVMKTTTNFMIEKGNTKTEYIENKEQNIHIPLNKGQLLHEGDYLASDGIHQKRDTYIFTGTEKWYKGNVPVEGTVQFYVGKSSTLKSLCNCTHFVTTKTINGIALGNFMNFYPSTELGLTTVEQWKSYLAEQYANGTPVIVEYELAEEIVIPYTPEQEEAYYELQHLLMYEGYTKIECIDEIKPDIQGTYYFNNELNNSYGERFDKVEDSINELEEEINNNNTKITTIESDINSLEANKLTSKGTNSTQGSWQSVPLDDNDHFVILVISGTNYTDWKILPKSLIKKYTPSSTLKIIHNGTTIVQIAWNANSMVEYIWTTGYTITHYTY